MDVLTLPLHCGPLESSLNYPCIRTFPVPEPMGSPADSGERVVHPGMTLEQITPAGTPLRGRAPPAQARKMQQHAPQSVVYEEVQDAVERLGGQATACFSHCLPNCMPIPSRMSKIYDAHCISSVNPHPLETFLTVAPSLACSIPRRCVIQGNGGPTHHLGKFHRSVRF